jgi:hypothetical protein
MRYLEKIGTDPKKSDSEKRVKALLTSQIAGGGNCLYYNHLASIYLDSH